MAIKELDPKARLRYLLLERPEYRALYQVSPEFRFALDGIVELMPLFLKTAADAAEEGQKVREERDRIAFDRMVGKPSHRVKTLDQYV